MGTDPGKSEHHRTAFDAEGERRLSRRVANDETTLLELIGELLELSEGEPVTWAVDLNTGGAATDRAVGRPRKESPPHPAPDRPPRLRFLPGRRQDGLGASSWSRCSPAGRTQRQIGFVPC
ncbi:IS110 family transposase [Streptomyces tendae]